jgi:protein-S-isoprenylcysteine O-methyltransferase Ste14
MTLDNERDRNAGVIAPPPLIALAVVVFGLLLDRLLPTFVLTVLLPFTARLVIGAVLAAIGIGLAFAALRAFRAARTAPEPWKPSSALVVSGIFSHLRNPMYVGGNCLLAGIAIALASDWMLVLLVASSFLMHFGVVLREERYLEARFGDAYRDYKASVSRYGWPG